MSRNRRKHSPAVSVGPQLKAPGSLAAALAGWRPDWRVAGICALLFLAVLLVFGNTIGHGFVNYDDDQYVYENPFIMGGVTWKGLAWSLAHAHVGNWHPLTSLSHMIDCQLFGLDAGGHHFVNVILHAATAMLLFLLVRSMTRDLWPSAIVAILFAIHPLRAESVAWVSERKDVLSGLLFVLTLLAYTRYARRPFSIGRYLLVALFLAAGLMSKPMLVTLPALLFVLDFWPLKRWGCSARPEPESRPFLLRRVVLDKIPLLMVSAAFCWIALRTQRITMESTETLPMGWRLGNALVAYTAYLGKTVWPFDLTPFYPHPRNTLALWQPVAAALALAGITSAAALAAGKRPWLLAGWLWFLGMLVPVIGLVQVGSQAMADRYTYLPHIGLWIGIVFGLAALARRWPQYRVAGTCALAALLVLLMLRTADQASHWRSSRTLWTHTLDCDPRNCTAHLNFANALVVSGDVAGAMEHFNTALALKPDYAMARNNLGFALMMIHKPEEAIRQYRKALEVSPRFAEAHFNLGNALAELERSDEAMAAYRAAIEINPQLARAHNNLGAALDNRGRTDEAIAEFQKALSEFPQYADAQFNYGNALAHKGLELEALERWREAVRLNPAYAKAHLNLGVTYFNRGLVNEGVSHLRRAVELAPKWEEARQALRTAVMEQARLARAVNH